ncbi:uncharacterized protein L3040_007388 [Drepanopeziza brunnea f. sp. 'multigermtubi']|uniref:uncharacterized protein n=1 Tax=Drepanopeziza brunnea f. sp. 'multigermtubi' TaxID=698441 RepID=UPI00239CFEAA|nr:hypothetical protein L3040_007388 [Drepanopeziza brunnea f. sp. 'multigermtubi']
MIAIRAIETFVLLFPNDEWSSRNPESVVSRLRPNISFAQRAEKNLETLSTRDADLDGKISGFLYVPDLKQDDACFNVSKEYVPANVTRQANLAPTDYTLVALAPWISVECTLSYMRAARSDPVRALIFYQANNVTDPTTPPSGSSAWDLRDGGAWRTKHQFPVYAVPGVLGSTLMRQLSLYSGNMTEVPYGHQLTEVPGVDPRDYVRLYTQIRLGNKTILPRLWVYFLVISAVLMICLGGISAVMHVVQRARRKSLHRRVVNGEVDLEALGIKRLKIPLSEIERLPLFIYTSEDEASPPMSPQKAETVFTTIERHDLADGCSTSPGSEYQVRYALSTSNDSTIPELVPIDDSTPYVPAVVAHTFLPYIQPTCEICLEDFESGISEIRELPCGHIFHPECIDTFLSCSSSLCPICKKSALPLGCCPTRITNAMVRRERNLRKVRSRIKEGKDDEDLEAYGTRRRVQDITATIRRNLGSAPSVRRARPPLPDQPQPVFVANHEPSGCGQYDTLGKALSREELVGYRIRELEAAQVPLRDPDLVRERQPPRWLNTLSNAFPGF